MFNLRKILAAGVVASVLAGGLVATSAPASAQWLVRGVPLHVGVIHYRHYYGYRHYYAYHRFYRNRFFLRNCFGFGFC